MSAATRPARWRCHTCGETFTAWAAAERHADAHGGGRVECLFTVRGDAPREGAR